MDGPELLQNFKLERVLLEDSKNKSVALLGKIHDDYAILSAEKTAFDVTSLDQIVLPAEVVQDMSNDVYVYHKHKLFVSLKDTLPSHPGAKYTLIYPATETHIKKYSPQRRHMIKESPEMYYETVRPFILSMIGKRLEWVYNILDHKAEEDRIVFEDSDRETGFIMLPDLKWDGKTLSALYFLCIVHRRDLKSVRDLRGVHLDLLRNIRDAAKFAVCSRYDLQPDQLRLYFHYQPSYYHLHVHVQTCDYEAGEGLSAGKAILLDDAIELLSLNADAFKEKTMFYTLGEESELFQWLGAIRE